MFANLKDHSIQSILTRVLGNLSSRSQRKCGHLSDEAFLQLCLSKVSSNHQSGRDFLQYLSDLELNEVPKSTFFDSLHSDRRSKVIHDFSRSFYQRLKATLGPRKNHLSVFPELDAIEVMSGDGHYIEHACHTPSNDRGRRYAPGGIYLQDLRTGLVTSFAPVSDGTKKNHELPIFKSTLEREGIPKKKTIYVLDKAYINAHFWFERKFKNQLIITRLKENQELTVIGEHPFNSEDEVNTGVQRDCTVELASGPCLFRVIDYKDPESQTEYRFLTTWMDFNIRPGVIAYLYFLRWQLEKSFDAFKNAFLEKKAWATGQTAIRIQNDCIAMFHNFLHMILMLLKEENVEERKIEEKYRRYLNSRERMALVKGNFINPLMYLKRNLARLTVQFVRLIRNIFYQNIPLKHLLLHFKNRMEAYL